LRIHQLPVALIQRPINYPPLFAAGRRRPSLALQVPTLQILPVRIALLCPPDTSRTPSLFHLQQQQQRQVAATCSSHSSPGRFIPPVPRHLNFYRGGFLPSTSSIPRDSLLCCDVAVISIPACGISDRPYCQRQTQTTATPPPALPLPVRPVHPRLLARIARSTRLPSTRAAQRESECRAP
jgi:hypothetical protein